MPRAIAPDVGRPASALASASVLIACRSDTGAPGPPPQPEMTAGAGIDSRTLSTGGMNTEGEEHQPHPAREEQPAIAQQEFLGRLGLAGQDSLAVDE